MATLPDLLKQMVEMQGSDLHLSIGSVPQTRVHGELEKMTQHPELTPTETKSLSYAVLTDAQKKRFEETKELDFSFGIRGLARFRCNLFNQRGAVGAVCRSEEHTSELQSLAYLVCRLLLEKKKKKT